MTPKETEKILKAGQIAKQVKEYAKTIIKKDKPLLEIAEQIENKIIELGGKLAFPTNLSINDIAAHYTPSHNDETKAHGLLKIDLGVHIDGFVADTAFSVDLENSEENKKLIQASQEALENAIRLIKEKSEYVRSRSQNNNTINSKKNSSDTKSSAKKSGEIDFEANNFANTSEQEMITLSKIGETIQQTIESHGFTPIINLSGHSMEKYDLHAGVTIPNININSKEELEQGLYAIEPFTTSGNGKVYDGKPSGIYSLEEARNVRSPIAREILKLIDEEYQTLPFCSRWIVKKLGTKALFGLKQLEQQGILHQYPQLVEVSHKPVSQAENTILIEKNKVQVTTN